MQGSGPSSAPHESAQKTSPVPTVETPLKPRRSHGLNHLPGRLPSKAPAQGDPNGQRPARHLLRTRQRQQHIRMGSDAHDKRRLQILRRCAFPSTRRTAHGPGITSKLTLCRRQLSSPHGLPSNIPAHATVSDLPNAYPVPSEHLRERQPLYIYPTSSRGR